jgi:multiple sugar transport system ATP-binding protein
MAIVALNSVSKVYRINKTEEVHAVTNLTLQVADKELVTIVGPSGSGKTTTLRLIAGLEELSGGSISIDNVSVQQSRPAEREVAMVFQRDALYPHLTVFENMALGAELRSVAKSEIEERVKSAAATLGLGALLTRYPAALSSGQRQRVAFGRAIVRRPKVFLFDEPLSNLDAPTRTLLRAEISRLHRQLGATILYVTHDQAEAMMLGERIAVIKDGTLQQLATPRAIYSTPANLFVAGFIGSPPMNLFRGRILSRDQAFVFQENNPAGAAKGARFEVPLTPERGERLMRFAEGNVVLGLRPEHISVREGPAREQTFSPRLEMMEHLGVETHLHFHTGAHAFVARAEPAVAYRPGENVPLRFDLAAAMFFNPASGSPIV